MIEELVKAIKKSNYLVALTGAGISTLSGIPDFRTDKSGIWERYDQSRIFDISYFKKHPEYFYKFAKEYIYTFTNIEPAIAHKFLARLEEIGILKSITTQNVDGLHQKAGSKKVFELHGNPFRSHCLSCKKIFSQKEIEIMLKDSDVPLCNECSGLIKPDIIFYGEMLPEDAINSSIAEVEKCDLMLVLGTSLVVYPAAYLPEIALRNGALIAILNKQPTHLSGRAKWIIDDDLAVTCSMLIKYFE